MTLDKVIPGRSIPDEINVIVEIPRDGDTVKYEVDKATGVLFVDWFADAKENPPSDVRKAARGRALCRRIKGGMDF